MREFLLAFVNQVILGATFILTVSASAILALGIMFVFAILLVKSVEWFSSILERKG